MKINITMSKTEFNEIIHALTVNKDYYFNMCQAEHKDNVLALHDWFEYYFSDDFEIIETNVEYKIEGE
ncbi:hypothetical protein [Photorhabdus luminescens]|uniref:Uncharacterized protein n=1 Tax=Photorhabdus luminescens subsp. sonorensis TaxID=1173677 RepID=A0A5C4RJQ0_PHOLU|nr:hypothetical protein [Photorhabdus luminescens]TNH43787.1 hypothetical protein EP164_09585 [Photorhabdus luminescens subsp. sonorensis]